MSVATTECIDTGSRLGDLLWVEYTYTFDNSFVYLLLKKSPSLAEAEVECLALIPTIEGIVLNTSYDEIYNNNEIIDETMIPDFPDELPASDADLTVDTRRRQFHRWLVRRVWPTLLEEVSLKFATMWEWIEQQGNTAAQRVYLDLDVARFNTVSSRMGNAITVRELQIADEPGSLE